MRSVLIVLSCYRFIAVPSVLITIIVSMILLKSGTSLALVMVIWTKVITTGLLLLFVHHFRSSQFFFFNNLGHSNNSIYWNMIIVDVFIALVSFSLVML